ncbi:MAG TPA: hypothetical protein VM008_00300 [Phycisphaerae bacterium]|nr:hypothetical protein [Phycisphaerae bacterium]
MADRLWRGAEGWFESRRFRFALPDSVEGSLDLLLEEICKVPMKQVDLEDDYSSPVYVEKPFDLQLDWWMDTRAGGNRLKVWAGTMRSVRIAMAMRAALRDKEFWGESLLNRGMVVFDPEEPDKKVEPYYFDSRRGNNAQSRDIGFATDALQMTTAAYPAVEFLCLVGLQRFRPLPTHKSRVFEYCAWDIPCVPEIAGVMACGLGGTSNAPRYRFENAFRTDQKKHKAFLPATLIGEHS